MAEPALKPSADVKSEEELDQQFLEHETDFVAMDLPGMLTQAKKETGRTTFSIARDMAPRIFGKKRLTGEQYFNWRLYDDVRFTKEQKAEFIGTFHSRMIANEISPDGGLLGAIDNKLILGSLFAGVGVPAATTLAVMSDRLMPSALNWLQDKEALSRFLRGTDQYPLFGKPLGSSQSLGVMSLSGYDSASDELLSVDGKRISVEKISEEICKNFGKAGYVFQPTLKPHPMIAERCGNAIGTVRVVTVVEGDEAPRPLYAVWKIARPDAIADNFWRDGNLLAHVDEASGEVLQVRNGGGYRSRNIETHPNTGKQLNGIQLPDWQEAMKVVRDAHSLFAYSVKMIGWDLALTDQGPRIIEGNTRPNQTLYQVATGRGVYSDELLKGFHERFLAAKKEAEEKAKASKKEKVRNSRDRELRAVREGMKKKA